jgi:hypothetical protein
MELNFETPTVAFILKLGSQKSALTFIQIKLKSPADMHLRGFL